MKTAYLILTHKEPQQLKRLIDRLTDETVDVYIHLDKKVDKHIFEEVFALPNVFYVANRVKVNWGGFSIVKATLHGFKEIIDSGIKYHYVNLISGEDYPIQSQQTINNFFAEHPGKAFMEYLSVEKEWTEAIPRIRKYFLTDYKFPGSTKLEWLINTVLPERKSPLPFEFVGRSQWFSITHEQIKYILDFFKANRKFYRFFCFVWGSDEFVFQSILYNSPFRNDMVNNNLRYIDWSEGGVSPKSLTMADATQLLSSDKLIARKFNYKDSKELMDFLDEQRGN
jgi:hypothetical protein